MLEEKGGTLISSLITFLGVALQTAARNRAMFIMGRMIIGIAVTVNAVAAPTYVAELAHPKDRGVVTGIYMASWYFAAIIVTGISLGTYNLDSTWSWRAISLCQITPSVLVIPVLYFIPDSPRFLIFTGQQKKLKTCFEDIMRMDLTVLLSRLNLKKLDKYFSTKRKRISDGLIC